VWTPQVRVGLVKESSPSLNLPKQKGPYTAAQAFRKVIPPDATTERFAVIALDTQNVPVGACTVTVGLLNSSLIHPREVFQFAILCNAASVLLGHNHPSGDPEPSPEDLEVTWQLCEAGRLLGIPVRDHVIIAGDRHLSLLERGMIGPLPAKGLGAKL
jgi:DNA repair protein RadC